MTATEAQPNTDGNGDGGVAALVAQEVQPEGETQDIAQEPAATQFEVTLLLPTQDFVDVAHISQPRQPNAEGFLELPIPVAPTDAVQELRGLITESPEGFWLGAFGFVPVIAQEIVAELKEGEEKVYGPWVALVPPPVDPKATIPDPKAWKFTTEGVLGEFCELSAVFGDETPEGQKRGLKVVPTSFSPIASSLHLVRFRDTLYASLPTLSSNASYDPTSIAIGAGATLYTAVRGEAPVTEAAAEETDAKKPKATKNSAPAEEPTPEPAAAETSTPVHPFTNWSVKDLTPFAYLEHLRPAASPFLASPCIRALGISPWSPPPHSRRMRGDLVYLTLTTLEGESFQITAAASGFWVSKSTASTFDPSTKSTSAIKGLRSTPYHSLFELACALSPSFAKALVKIIETQNPSANAATDIYATLAISHAQPAASWLVPAPAHVADPFRTQLAFLLTGSTNADLLPPARDWNDEFGQYRDLPQSTLPERLLRERLLHRVQCDFASAATRGALSIARGDVPPLNPNEAVEAHTFIHNGMLFTRADDAIKAFAHLGGNSAARVAAAKDLAGVDALEALDVKGLSTMATVVVDYLGDRWVAQSLVPGLFKTKEEDDEAKLPLEGDEDAAKKAQEADQPFPNLETANREDYPSSGAFRIVYGSANPEEPDERVRASGCFARLAQEVAERVHFAKHNVIATADNGEVTQLWTSTDMHGIAAPDGRSYFIDCFRMHCTDVEFLEHNVTGAIFSDPSSTEVNGVHTPPSYPHRLALLRPELLEAYRESKLEAWVTERLEEARARIDEEKKATASIESELKEAASDPSSTAAPAAPKPAPALIDANDFKLAFNPDAFVERKPLADSTEPAALIYDPEEESTKSVRLASLFLREKVLPDFVVNVVASILAVTDGEFLAKLMHRKGINMRYLGMLADVAERQGPTLEYPVGTNKADVEFGLRALKKTLQHAMVARAGKHVLNRLLRSSSPYDHSALISHFLNCLAGTALEPNPRPELSDLLTGAVADRAWATLTPSSLRQEINSEVEARFRYTVPSTFFSVEELVPVKLVREVCRRVGVQLVLREYKFGPREGGAVAGAGEEEENVEVVSGSEHPAGPKRRKKKGPAKVEREAAKADEHRTVTFRPDDVLNVMPVVKTTIHKSQLAEETFNLGITELDKGNVEVGQELAQDALNFYEQVFGSVHPEAASHYHTLGIMYHNMAQSTLRRVAAHEAAEEQVKAMAPAERAEGIVAKRLDEYLLENADVQRAEAENFFHQAVRMMRQSVIIAERTFGLDSPEAIQNYTDLGLLEQSIGNSEAGMKLTKHALNLWAAVYGPNHPSSLTLLHNVASMVQSQFGLTSSIPLLIECRELAESIYGEKSLQTAAFEYQLAQVRGLTGSLAEALVHATETVRLYTLIAGSDAKEAVEATAFIRVIEEALGRESREQAAQEERLRRKFPRLMADKEVRARIGAAGPSSSSGSAAGRRAGAPAPVPEEVEVPVVVKKEHGQKANLSIDELVNFIQGTKPKATPGSSASRATRKRKGSPPTSS